MGPLVQRAGQVRAREDGYQHPPLQLSVPKGGAREEAYGAMGGGQRRLREDAGADRGLSARPRVEEDGRLHKITGLCVQEIERDVVQEIARDSRSITW